MDYLNYLASLSGDDWRTVSIVGQGILMTVLVVTGIYQILIIRAENKKSRTIDICNRYSSDAVLNECLGRLYEARLSGDLDLNPLKYRPKVVGVLTYFEIIAVGIQQGIYGEKMTHQYHEIPLRAYVGRYLNNGRAKKFDIELESCKYLLALAEKWEKYDDAVVLTERQLALTLSDESQEKNTSRKSNESITALASDQLAAVA